jgi:hypothetical protein
MIECSKKKDDIISLAGKIDLSIQIGRLKDDSRIKSILQNSNALKTIEVCRFIVDHMYRQALFLQEKREVPVGSSDVCDLSVLASAHFK